MQLRVQLRESVVFFLLSFVRRLPLLVRLGGRGTRGALVKRGLSQVKLGLSHGHLADHLELLLHLGLDLLVLLDEHDCIDHLA